MSTETKKSVKNITLLGRKIGMTQVFDSSNRLVPVTVVEAGPCPVTQIKTMDNDSYIAVQIGYGVAKEKHLSKAQLGHFQKTGTPPLRTLREFRTSGQNDLKVGDVLTVGHLEEGQIVDVTGVTVGRGFQGVVKRHGFAGNPDSHGSMMHRRGGSYGARQTPGHVYKQRKMPGHDGCVSRTVQNLEIIKIIADKNIILVKGSFPGSEGTLVTIRTAKKTKIKA